MDIRTTLLLGCFCACLPVHSQTRQSAHYTITTETMDGGGLYATSADYVSDSSLASIAGVSSLAVPLEAALYGYLAQVYEVTQLRLAATPFTVGGGGASQLSGAAGLDDGTFLALNGADILWAPAQSPLASISPSGLATAGTPGVNTLASFSGAYLGVPGAGTIGVMVHPPVAPDFSVTTHTNTPLALSVAKLLAQASSPDQFALSLPAVSNPSAQGGSVVLGASTLIYTPATGFGGSDHFTYTIGDGHGGTATGTVTVTVGTPAGVSLNVVNGPVISDGNFVVRFAGVPGFSYTIEATDALGGQWTKVSNVTAPTTDTGFGVGVGYDRARAGDVGDARLRRGVGHGARGAVLPPPPRGIFARPTWQGLTCIKVGRSRAA